MSGYRKVRLEKHDLSLPWGFRLEGGINKNVPLQISMVHTQSIADRAGLRSGDYVESINNVKTSNMTHEEAKMEIIRGCNVIDFIVSTEECQYQMRKPKTKPQPLEINNFQDTVNPISLTQGEQFILKNESGGVRKVSHNDYNSPKGMYSKSNFNQNFFNRMQNAGVAVGELEKKSDQNHHIDRLKCHACQDFIKGAFVKVHNKYLMHPGCLKCIKCGIGLKNVGYFYINDKLFCEMHAKQAATPPGPDMKPMAIYR